MASTTLTNFSKTTTENVFDTRPRNTYHFYTYSVRARQGKAKCQVRLPGKQPPIIAQLDDIAERKTITLETNEDKEEKIRMETIMKDIQVQPWCQYEDDITKCNEKAIEDALMPLNKGLSQLVSKQSFKKVDSRTLTQHQLQQVVATRWAITERQLKNGTKGCQVSTLAATPSSMAMRLLMTVAILKNSTIYTICVASAFLSAPIEQEVLVQPPRGYHHNKPNTLWSMTKALYSLRTSPKQWQEHLSTILQQLGFTRLKSDACVFVNAISAIYIVAHVDDLPVVGDQCYSTTLPTTISTRLGSHTHKSTLNSQGQLHLNSLGRQSSYN
eukprot:3785110-Amphidinium_carterae.1